MEQILKQRLVGAIVLISLAVIFIPIILEGPDDEWMPRTHSIPEPPQMDYGARLELPVPVEEAAVEDPAPLAAGETGGIEADAAPVPPAAPAGVTAVDPLPEPTAAVPPGDATADVPAQQTAAATPEPEDTGEPDKAAELPSGGWVIQVGSFSSERNATGLRERLKSSGYEAWLQDVSIGQRRIFRVVVGPLQDREAAEKMRDRLRNEMQLRGIVVENKG